MIDLDAWRPRASWATTVAAAHEALARDPHDGSAWLQLVMMMGDSGAPELGLLVALHAGEVAPDARPRLGAHLALFVIDLGLGVADASGKVTPHPGAIGAWRDAALAELGCDLATAAWRALEAAVEKTTAPHG